MRVEHALLDQSQSAVLYVHFGWTVLYAINWSVVFSDISRLYGAGLRLTTFQSVTGDMYQPRIADHSGPNPFTQITLQPMLAFSTATARIYVRFSFTRSYQCCCRLNGMLCTRVLDTDQRCCTFGDSFHVTLDFPWSVVCPQISSSWCHIAIRCINP